MKLISHEESISCGESVLKLTFDPGTVEDGLLTVECRLDHPFYVKNKGMTYLKYAWLHIKICSESDCRFCWHPIQFKKGIKAVVQFTVFVKKSGI